MIAMTTSASAAGRLMTIGELSRHTGVSVKVLRRYEARGLLYTAGRSAANYRLFDRDALWCVAVITGLRNLGLTVTEISELAGIYLGRPDQPIGPSLAERLQRVRRRLDEQIAVLTELRRRIDDFAASHPAALAGLPDADFRTDDPRAKAWPA